MGWYALYKWFRPWRKRPYVNYIKWYNDVLEQQWLEKLSPPLREQYEKKKKHEFDTTMWTLHFMKTVVDAWDKYRIK